MKTLFAALLFLTSTLAFADEGRPVCVAELNDEVNTPVFRVEWSEVLYMGAVRTPTRTILVSTSLGDNKVMSLWVRDKREKPNGMFSFLDLSTGRDQYMRFYMDDGFSLGVTCRWEERM